MSNWQALYLRSVVWELLCQHVCICPHMWVCSFYYHYRWSMGTLVSGYHQAKNKDESRWFILSTLLLLTWLIFSSPSTIFSSSSQNQYVSVSQRIWFTFSGSFQFPMHCFCQTHFFFFFCQWISWVSGIDLVSLITWQSSLVWPGG